MAAGKNAGLDLGLLVLRLMLGLIFIAHGVVKLKGPGLEGFSDYLGTLAVPYPYPAAVAVISAEVGGGLLLILGLFARLGALALSAVTAGSIVFVHMNKDGLMFQKAAVEQGEYWTWGMEYNLALLAMALCVLLAGAGSISFLPPKGKKKAG